ncbi:alkaline phosphatase [Sporobolomyces salmoneus]|uniref:alkaline phosphatase n=1 Tax=Sporobolomyces salmoneus TaxID=183962 RepID=UPI00317F47CB
MVGNNLSNKRRLSTLAVVGTLFSAASAQTFRRTAACGTGLGCLFPPDQVDFVAGSVFDIRTEVQAPLNGSRPYNNGVPDSNFTITIGRKKDGSDAKPISKFFEVDEPVAKNYNFTYYEDLFYSANKTATFVNVVSKDWRHVALYEPGDYYVKLKYNSGSETKAQWTVLPVAEKRKAKNVIMFIADGTPPSAFAAARLIGHKSINGRYQSLLTVDESEGLGIQMTHSLDSFITDSANSATALMAGKKSTVNSLNAYTDSTGSPYDNTRFETIFEMGRRINGAQIGIVSTAYIADATPAAVCAHTSKRGEYSYIIEQYLNGASQNHSWTQWDGPDVLFGGGGSDFLPKTSNGNVSQIKRWQDRGYEFVTDNTTLHNIGNDERALGLFSASTMPTWLDRTVYKENLNTTASFAAFNSDNDTFSAPNVDSPGLLEMTLKAIDILHTRSEKNDVPFMLLSEAASVDKQLHAGDSERAIGDLLELDNTIKHVLKRLEELGLADDTLILMTADHAHGFDVFGSVDTAYMSAQVTDAGKRTAIGTYQESGLSGYQVPQAVNPQDNQIYNNGSGFPATWDPRYTAAFGYASTVDTYADYRVHNQIREMAIENEDGTYSANKEDAPDGFFLSGNLPPTNDQGVHSLSDVNVYTWGPGHELFRGVMNSPDIANRIALALDLGRKSNVTYSSKGKHGRGQVKL